MIINADNKIDDLKFQIESGITEAIDDNYESLSRFPSNSSGPEQLLKNKNNSYEKLKEVSKLVDLKEFIENFQLCELKKTSKNTVFSDGNSESKLMFIGEAPGQQEDLEGKPFVGKSGKLLDKILHPRLNPSLFCFHEVIRFAESLQFIRSPSVVTRVEVFTCEM